MSLENIYQRNVNKNPINQAGISSGIPASRERDPQLIKLENDVFSQMRAILPQEKNENKTKPQINVQNVGLEQALKELLNGTKSTDNKS